MQTPHLVSIVPCIGATRYDCILPMNRTPLPKHLCKYPLPWIASPVIILYHATGSSRPEVPPVAGPVFGHLFVKLRWTLAAEILKVWVPGVRPLSEHGLAQQVWFKLASSTAKDLRKKEDLDQQHLLFPSSSHVCNITGWTLIAIGIYAALTQLQFWERDWKDYHIDSYWKHCYKSNNPNS